MNRTEGDVAIEPAELAAPRFAREVPQDLTPLERRKYVRFACPTEASVRLPAGTSARVLDLGLGGALVESSTRLAPGSITAVVFTAADVAFRVRTRVRRVFVSGFKGAPGGGPLLYRAGLEFESLSPADACAVEALVSNVAGITAPPPVIPATHALGVAPGPSSIQPDRTVFIRFPAGWATTTRQRAVLARAPGQRGYVFLGAPQVPSGDLGEFARASMHGAGFFELLCEPAEINGLPACIGFYTGWLEEFGAVMVEAAYVVLDNQTYLIAGVAPWATYESVQHEFFATINSFGEQAWASAYRL